MKVKLDRDMWIWEEDGQKILGEVWVRYRSKPAPGLITIPVTLVPAGTEIEIKA